MSEEELTAHLRRLGLGDHECAVYALLLGRGPSTVDDLAAHLEWESPRAQDAVDRLINCGLLATSGAAPGAVAPVDPTIGAQYLARARESELKKAEVATANAYRAFRRTVWPQPTDDLVEVVTGPPMLERIRLAESTAETEICRLDSPPYFTGGQANPQEIANLGNGVQYRVVYARAALEDSDYYASNIKECIAAGEQARVLPSVPVKLSIFDQKQAQVSLSVDEAEVNRSLLIVRPSSLLSALSGLFETLWRSAFPMHRGDHEPSVLRPVERRIIELLAAGMTDNAIAELLGISRRTLSRNLEQVTRRAGATSRFQLALHASRKGWI